eukprot:6932657-Karenia_brevis.AAC.1
MMRWMLGSQRRPLQETEDTESEDEPEPEAEEDDEPEAELESWIDWMKRTTNLAEEHLHKVSVDDW